MDTALSRRDMLFGSACMGALTSTAAAFSGPQVEPASPPFRYSLNTGTLMGCNLPLAQEIEIAAKAGYQGFEPWLRAVQKHLEEGKSLADLRKRIGDLGLTVEGAIGFASWVVDDDAQRAKGLEQMKHDMDLVAQLGGRRIAAPPAGASGPIDFRKIAERYRAVLELGRRMGVVPQLEIWGTSKALSRPSEAALVAIEAAHSDACLLLDVFHMYRSGASFGGLRVINGACLHVFHMNDYPADPPREKATDADRIYPGDGIAPLASILRDLRAAGFRGALSLELFNRTYWKQDPLTVARTGLAKMKAAAEASLAVGKPGETK